MSADARGDFLGQMRQDGLTPHSELELIDGQLERFRVAGDKAGSRNGWAIMHTKIIEAGAFGSWRTGAIHTWRGQSPADETAAQRATRLAVLQDIQRQRKAELDRVQASGRQRAGALWAKARPATSEHPYLQAKRVPAYGIRRLGPHLVVPLRDVCGVLHSLQFIAPDGTKRFLTGGRIRGCYFSIGKPNGELLLGEGLATCSTLRQATGSAVAVCFNCGNLEPVARALREKFPQLRIIICADNDLATPGNPGLTAGSQAAASIGALLAVPRFDEEPA
jgi:putative DNA primase/helicase